MSANTSDERVESKQVVSIDEAVIAPAWAPDFFNTTVTAAQVIEKLRNPKTTSLSLQATVLSAEDKLQVFKEVATNKNLLTLNLRGTEMTADEACKLADCLKANTTLKQLDVGLNPIGDNGALVLASLLTLEELSLRNTGISDNFALELPESGATLALDLGANFIANTGAQALLINKRIDKNSLGSLLFGNYELDDESTIAAIQSFQPTNPI